MKNTTEATMASTTNLMPDLAPWDYELLKASIARVGCFCRSSRMRTATSSTGTSG